MGGKPMDIGSLDGIEAQTVESIENQVITNLENDAVRAAEDERRSKITEFNAGIDRLLAEKSAISKELRTYSNVWKERAAKQKELQALSRKIASIEEKKRVFEEASRARRLLKAVPDTSNETLKNEASAGKKEDETQREHLIRTGRITPFQSENASRKSVKRRHVVLSKDRHRKQPKVVKKEVYEDGGHPVSSDEDNSDDDYVPADEIRERSRQLKSEDHEEDLENAEDMEEVLLPEGLRIPAKIYDKLFDYQKVGVQWMWELHLQDCGGIIGDEMGLGKTVQVIAFLAALRHSRKLDGPVIVVAPTTVLQQWQREFKVWAPQFRVHILHHSVNSSAEGVSSDASLSSDGVIDQVINSDDGVLVTNYEQVRKHHEKFLASFEYVILDEGHKIRNPNAAITLICKQFETTHRIIMSGSPLQNHLKELWSLFDFVFPGKLGTLPVFEEQFSVPIAVGGYISATKSEVHTAYKCAVVLRDLVQPYLLRRLKKDVALQLPKKNEQVLFCKLTLEQRKAYEDFVGSRAVREVLSGKLNLLAAISTLRKICNHPDIASELGVSKRLREKTTDEHELEEDYGYWKKSGKFHILTRILPVWLKSGSRALLFSQTRTMLDIVEIFAKSCGYRYLRMDGETAIGRRMALIDEFNDNDDVFLFLLTTKVGGLGVNLTGADRVVIIDPDWNPATDLQARERSWRIGQKRAVAVYRLITSGTIEEKMYHRQIYKQFLSNKVLSDPRQRRFFKPKHLRDLFALGSEDDVGTETGDLFAGTRAKEKLQVEIDEEEEGEIGSYIKEGANYGRGTAVEQEAGGTEEAEDEKGDTVLLKDLFDNPEGTGLHSAMDHDEIVNAGSVGVDIKLMDYEAEKVASKAAEELARSREERLRMGSVSVPTWTGEHGTAGIPSRARPRIGGSSSKASGLLNQIRKREGAVAAGGNLSSKVPSSTAHVRGTPVRASMMDAIVQFLQVCGGTASSVAVINKFRDRVGSDPKDLALFKAMLKKVAVLKKGGGADGKAAWILKSSFR